MAKTTSKPREFLRIGVPAFSHRYGVEGVAFTHDGKSVLISGGKETRVVDVQSAQTITTLKQGGPISLLKNDTLLMAGPSLANNEMFGSVTVQEIATKKKLFSFDSCTCSAVAPDDNLMAFGNYRKITLMSLNPLKELATVDVGSEDHGMVESLAFSNNGKYLASGGVHAGGTKDVFIWTVDGETLTLLHSLQVESGRVDALAFASDDKTLLIGSLKLVVWNFEENIVKEIPVHPAENSGNLRCLTISADGKLIAGGSQDATIRVWKADDYSEIVCLQPDDRYSWIEAVAFSPDGKIVAGGGANQRVSLVDTASGDDAEFGPKHKDTILFLAGNSERLFSSGHDRTLRAWNLKSGVQEVVVNSEFGLALSPDGKQLIHGGPKGSLIIRETIGDLPIVKTLERHTAAVSDICWSTDGSLIVSGGWDATIREWCPGKGEILTITSVDEDDLDTDHSKRSKKSKKSKNSNSDDSDDLADSDALADYDLPGHDEYCTEDCDIHRTPEVKTLDKKGGDLKSEI
ncbi:MAG: WD40 repeat domain-containing protein [Candidatus Melainabacteria bacterium]|nr:WD40 repeat domain-containing protein [Candidatus Melainabacteria bacterium]